MHMTYNLVLLLPNLYLQKPLHMYTKIPVYENVHAPLSVIREKSQCPDIKGINTIVFINCSIIQEVK